MSSRSVAQIAYRIRDAIIGRARDIRDPNLLHRISLVAFFAWVGLGADGLSSANYGPQESFVALGSRGPLGIFVALATAVTVLVIAASYSQIVELFPSGGGGYLVASKLLSPSLGMISGCALLVDYVLTITLSIASGADAIFSFLPIAWQPFKPALAVLGVLVLTVLNLRGVRESVTPLVPIFVLFLLTHAFAIVFGLGTHLLEVGNVARATAADTRAAAAQLGGFGAFVLVLRAYSMGAGTYTGIEAVSNGLPILREPRVQTARRTMRLMSGSLAFMAAGLMIGYLLYGVGLEPGKTFNAVLLGRIASGWGPAGSAFVLVSLVSEAALLFVAAQTGFLDGPRVLANMSLDRWLPSQFSLLSERLVTRNGVLLMGGASLVLMIVSRGAVSFLIVLYAINVFITFCLSQTGMVRHWWRERRSSPGWGRRIAINGVGLALAGFILVSQLVLKFAEGGWVTMLITGSLVGVAVAIKRTYLRTGRKLTRLDALMTEVTSTSSRRARRRVPRFDLKAKTAVILVSGFNGTGLHTLLNVQRLFGDTFRNWAFIQAGIIDADRFKGPQGIEQLRQHVEASLARYVAYVQSEGYHAEGFPAIGTDVVDEVVETARRIFRRNPRSVFFGGQIVFTEETMLTRLLYNHTTFATQRRLHQLGIPFIIMPVRVS